MQSLNYSYIYCLFKVIVYFFGLIFIYLNKVECITILELFSVTLDIAAIVLSIKFFRTLNLKTESLAFILILFSCSLLFFYPIAWDDLSYGLELPRIFLSQGSFKPVSEYGLFTYFPLIEYSRTAITFALGNTFQIFIYRIELLALYLLSFASLMFICQKGSTKVISDEYKFYFVLLLMTTFSSFGVYGFVKAESFINTCLIVAIVAYLSGDRTKAIVTSLIATPFKYTSIFTSLPILALAIAIPGKKFVRPSLLTLIACLAIITGTFLWILNNYKYTGVPLYPLFISNFTYIGDGLMDADEYVRTMKTLLNQQDVSILSIKSIKYFKYIFTQIGGLLLFTPIFFLIFFKNKLQFNFSKEFRWIVYGSALMLVFFVFTLFNEFRYVYVLISMTMLSVLMIIKASISPLKEKYFFYFLIAIICLQITFIGARNIKNSIYDHSLSYLPINLAIEQRKEISCIRSISESNLRVATFEQTFFLWKSPFFFIHELNEYIGLDPKADQIKYAFDKFQVNYILLPDSYKNENFISSLEIGGVPRKMPRNFLRRLNQLYTLEAINNDACESTSIYHLIKK